jgi:hypothetical protein
VAKLDTCIPSNDWDAELFVHGIYLACRYLTKDKVGSEKLHGFDVREGDTIVRRRFVFQAAVWSHP